MANWEYGWQKPLLWAFCYSKSPLRADDTERNVKASNTCRLRQCYFLKYCHKLPASIWQHLPAKYNFHISSKRQVSAKTNTHSAFKDWALHGSRLYNERPIKLSQWCTETASTGICKLAHTFSDFGMFRHGKWNILRKMSGVYLSQVESQTPN